ncbi:ferredoxin reductase family protein [Vibrio salinus]|uniref:ferredoxin reductase family protein n=1 Tax=Vibrio salinus TaxID=2899784 RepID=UPI001E45CDE8|nr:ferric reductase-like transmembrane domain-containing protein [Vibrio salinus]MCE0495397.1 ferric reductase-like transmembrane domain-containing protein [Vibrio salinus]
MMLNNDANVMKTFLFICLILWFPTLFFTEPENSQFFYWRHHLTILTGFIGFACMTVSVILALRLKWVEDRMNGLDNMYALHKRMGITALISLVLHWLIIKSAKWLIALDIIARRRRGSHFGSGHGFDGINWTHLAKEVGEYTFYIFVIFVAISLIQIISYRKFRFIHKIAGALFIAGAFHSLILMDLKWSSLSIDIFIILMCLIGTIGALISLTGKIGKANQSEGEITSYKVYGKPNVSKRVVHLFVRLRQPVHYKEGQFAYLNFHDGEAPHPFTILDYNTKTQSIEFAIKELGDYTSDLIDTISTLKTVTIEGGYGRFHIPKENKQIWVGSGIGVVPFISWLQWQNKHTDSIKQHQSIDFYYCRHSQKEAYFENVLQKLVRPFPNISLHIFTREEQGRRLTTEDIIPETSLTESVSVSFCGPVEFSRQLSERLFELGLPEHRFHCEKFVMR